MRVLSLWLVHLYLAQVSRYTVFRDVLRGFDIIVSRRVAKSVHIVFNAMSFTNVGHKMVDTILSQPFSELFCLV